MTWVLPRAPALQEACRAHPALRKWSQQHQQQQQQQQQQRRARPSPRPPLSGPPRLALDLLLVRSGARPAMLLDYGPPGLPPTPVVELVGALNALPGWSGAAGQDHQCADARQAACAAAVAGRSRSPGAGWLIVRTWPRRPSAADAAALAGCVLTFEGCVLVANVAELRRHLRALLSPAPVAPSAAACSASGAVPGAVQAGGPGGKRGDGPPGAALGAGGAEEEGGVWPHVCLVGFEMRARGVGGEGGGGGGAKRASRRGRAPAGGGSANGVRELQPVLLTPEQAQVRAH